MKDCRKIRAVVFDLDGTLLNTLPDIGASANRALRRAGLPELPVENYRGLIGHGIRALFRLAVPEGTPDDVYEKALADYLADYPEHCTELTHAFSGIYEMLGRLKRAGYRLAVLSNKTERTTLRIIGKFFPETGFKPAPDAGEALCKELGLMPEEIIYVGDGDSDMEFASNVGFFGTGVTWGYRSRKQLAENGEDALVDSAEEITRLLNA